MQRLSVPELFAALWKTHKSHTSSYNLLVHTRTLDFSSERAHAQANSGASAAQVTARVFSSSAAVINCMGLVIFVDVRRVLILRFAVEVAYCLIIYWLVPRVFCCASVTYTHEVYRTSTSTESQCRTQVLFSLIGMQQFGTDVSTLSTIPASAMITGGDSSTATNLSQVGFDHTRLGQHFNDFPSAMLLLFQVLTGEDWVSLARTIHLD